MSGHLRNGTTQTEEDAGSSSKRVDPERICTAVIPARNRSFAGRGHLFARGPYMSIGALVCECALNEALRGMPSAIGVRLRMGD